MNARACGRVSQFSLNYTAEIFNEFCAKRQNLKTINCVKKLKLLLNLH